MPSIQDFLPLQLLLVLAASFLIGLEMEERKVGGKQFTPGGVRTSPLICLAGFLLAKFGGTFQPAFVAGLLILGLWLALLYRAKIAAGSYGFTTEMFSLVTYVLGGLAAAGLWWLVAALTVLMVMLQEFKEPLEKLATRLPANELATLAKFVLLTAVIFPLMPKGPYTRLEISPQKVWLIVVAVAGVSYAGYLLQRLTGRARHGLLLTGLVGGIYSSTATTVALARQNRTLCADEPPGVVAGSILAASGMMNVRLIILVGIFDLGLMKAIAGPLGLAGLAGIVAGVSLALLAGRRTATPIRNSDFGIRNDTPRSPVPHSEFPIPNSEFTDVQPAPPCPPVSPRRSSPLELRTAIGFAILFVAVLCVTRATASRLGNRGLYGLAALAGLADVDPFVLSLTQRIYSSTGVAAFAIVLTAAVNDLIKGLYAAFLAQRRTGRLALYLLAGLALVTVGGWAACVQLGWAPAPR